MWACTSQVRRRDSGSWDSSSPLKATVMALDSAPGVTLSICTEQFSSLSPLGVVNVARGIKDVASSGPVMERKRVSPPWSAIRYSRWTVMPLSVALWPIYCT